MKLSAFQRLQDQLKWVDLVFEVRDARAPRASGHPQAANLFGKNPRVIVLAKQDLADPRLLEDWLQSLSDSPGQTALAVSLKQAKGREAVISAALKLTAPSRQKRSGKGLLPRPMRACVVGMPNVGKSSLINWLVGRRKALVGDRPGVTKGAQWVRLHAQLELLDTPGILPNTSLPENTRLTLAVLNLLPEALYDLEEVSTTGIRLIEDRYPGRIAAHYGITTEQLPTLISIAKVRNCLSSGGKLDTRRAASLLYTDIKEGRLGRLTLESPVTNSDQ